MKSTTTQDRRGEPAPMAKVLAKLRELSRQDFFGEVAITFQAGKPHVIKVHRTYKVEKL